MTILLLLKITADKLIARCMLRYQKSGSSDGNIRNGIRYTSARWNAKFWKRFHYNFKIYPSPKDCLHQKLYVAKLYLLIMIG